MKTKSFSIFVLTQLSFVFGSPQLTSPKKCELSDQPCLMASAQPMVPYLAGGIPELGIESLDVMYIDAFHVKSNEYLDTWTNTYIEGLKNSVIDILSVDLGSKVLRLIFHSDLSLRTDYSSGGYLLTMPISGAGEATMNISNVEFEFVFNFEIIKDTNDKNVIDLKDYTSKYDVKDGITMRFANLYNGNKELSDKMHVILHENWKPLSIACGRFLFEKTSEKIYKAIRTYLTSIQLEDNYLQ